MDFNVFIMLSSLMYFCTNYCLCPWFKSEVWDAPGVWMRPHYTLFALRIEPFRPQPGSSFKAITAAAWTETAPLTFAHSLVTSSKGASAPVQE